MRGVVAAVALALTCPHAVIAQRLAPSAAVRTLSADSRAVATQERSEVCADAGSDVIRYLASLIGTWSGGVSSWMLVGNINRSGRRTKGDAGYQPNANTAYAIGSWAGAVLGIWAVHYEGCGSFKKAAIGAAVPSLVLLFGRYEPYLPLLGVVYVAPFQALGATLAYH